MARKELRHSVIAVLLAALLWAMAFFDLPRLYLFSAAAGVLEKTDIHTIPETLKKFGADRLTAENSKLSAEVALLEARLKEMETSGRLSAARAAKTAMVVSIPPQSPYDIITIDAGTESGIQKGEKVFAGTAFIGFVDELGE